MAPPPLQPVVELIQSGCPSELKAWCEHTDASSEMDVATTPFSRECVRLQPLHQRQVGGSASELVLRRMYMCVDHARAAELAWVHRVLCFGLHMLECLKDLSTSAEGSLSLSWVECTPLRFTRSRVRVEYTLAACTYSSTTPSRRGAHACTG
eukprot:scaffold179717_cov37-Tisochrysis_lutea.AAC.2